MSGRLGGVGDRARARWRAASVRERRGLAAAVVGLLALVPLVTRDFFVMNMFVFVFIFVMLGHAWNVIGGYAGQISLGHAIMFAVGAYTTTVLFVYYNVTPYVGIPVGGLVATAVGVALGVATFRLRYHYFAMATLAAALAFRIAFFRWEFVNAASGIEYPFDQLGTLYSFTFREKWPYYYVTGAGALLTTLLVYVLDRSKLGTYLKAINMDQELAENAGIRAFYYKSYAMGISSFIAGVAGGLYAQYVLFIDPQSTLRLLRNIDIIMVAIIGGVGTVTGPVLGAFVFIPVREYTRTALSGQATGLGWVALGVVILLISLYRPGGLINKRVLDVEDAAGDGTVGEAEADPGGGADD